MTVTRSSRNQVNILLGPWLPKSATHGDRLACWPACIERKILPMDNRTRRPARPGRGSNLRRGGPSRARRRPAGVCTSRGGSCRSRGTTTRPRPAGRGSLGCQPRGQRPQAGHRHWRAGITCVENLRFAVENHIRVLRLFETDPRITSRARSPAHPGRWHAPLPERPGPGHAQCGGPRSLCGLGQVSPHAPHPPLGLGQASDQVATRSTGQGAGPARGLGWRDRAGSRRLRRRGLPSGCELFAKRRAGRAGCAGGLGGAAGPGRSPRAPPGHRPWRACAAAGPGRTRPAARPRLEARPTAEGPWPAPAASRRGPARLAPRRRRETMAGHRPTASGAREARRPPTPSAQRTAACRAV
jgi:hypothetical protein